MNCKTVHKTLYLNPCDMHNTIVFVEKGSVSNSLYGHLGFMLREADITVTLHLSTEYILVSLSISTTEFKGTFFLVCPKCIQQFKRKKKHSVYNYHFHSSPEDHGTLTPSDHFCSAEKRVTVSFIKFWEENME